MALNNYTGIAASVTNWLNRVGFSEITDQVEDFIALAHNRIIREVRAPFMETSAAQAISDTTGEGSPPADYLDARSLMFTDASASKTTGLVRAPRYVVETKQDDSEPCKFYEVENGTIYVGPKPAAADTFILSYYADPGTISTSVATNTISDAAPELYLYGALIEAAIFMKEAEIAALYKNEFNEARSRVESYAIQYESSGDVLTGRRERPYRESNPAEAKAVELIRQALADR